MIDVRRGWLGHPRLADAVVAAGAAALTVLVARARTEGLAVYPQLSEGTALSWLLPPAWAPTARTALVPILACAGLYWRRRRPVVLALVMVALTVSWPVAVPLLVSLFTVAATCSARTAATVTAVALAPVAVRPLLPSAGPTDAVGLVAAVSLVVGAVGWGLYLAGVQERAARAEQEADLRAAQARRRAREEIAREMHDVLAHRLTLLNMHAGALEFHPTAAPQQVAEAVGVIRQSAGQALEDLQTVLRVLRAPVVSDHAEPPQPTLRETARLIEEARSAGAEVRVDHRLADLATMDAITGRTAYRVLQEALTNHRKHAPGTPVDLTLTGGPDDGLSITAANGPRTEPASGLRGSGQGLIGMQERVHLAGGRMSHRLTAAGFHLDVWLPWTV